MLDSYLQVQLDAVGIPGAGVTVVQHGVQVHSAAFGRADDSGRALTPQTPVLLASTSKSLTAIAVMEQVEAGRLRLDEPVQTYLHWFTMNDSRASAITVRHLPWTAHPARRSTTPMPTSTSWASWYRRSSATFPTSGSRWCRSSR